jgi:8-oxo-dGTP pyrophosphatase MutT (NUDIX family)
MPEDQEDIVSPETQAIEAAAAIAIVNDKVLLVEEGEGSSHITGMLGIPSGRVKPGESTVEAALREFEEETGLQAEIGDIEEFPGNLFQADIPRKGGQIKRYNWHVYRIKRFSGKILETADNVKPIWTEISQLEELHRQGKLLPNVFNAVQAATKAV